MITLLATSLFLMLFVTRGSGFENVTQAELCPVWMSKVRYNNSFQTCECDMAPTLQCIGTTTFDLEKQHCLSYDASSEQVLVGLCPYSYYQQNYIKTLKPNVTPSELNTALCGPLNREGLLCSKCTPGHGIPIFSKVEDRCMKCGSPFVWPLYFALVLLPITLFYILIAVFNLPATHPPFTAYIFYCQVFTQTLGNFRFIRDYFETNTNHIFLRLTLTVCDIWSLDVLRCIVPGFCLSERLTNTDVLFLELITAFFPIALIVLTTVLIELHARNFRAIVVLWKPFHRCCSSLRRGWNPRSSVINAFATFLLLSVVKVCFVTTSFLYTLKFVRRKSHNAVLYIEPTIKFYDIYKQAYFIPTLLLFVMFALLPILLLCCYPTRAFRHATQCLCSARQRNALFIFMECFQGQYKNGTTGSYDYRAASSIGFMIRVLIGIRLHYKLSSRSTATSGSITLNVWVLIMVSLFYALVRPCKKQYANILESLVYFASALLLMVTIHNNYFPQIYHIILALILLPSILLAGVGVYRVLDVLGAVGKMKKVCFKKGADGEGEVSVREPHRLVHPTQYTPLLGQ